MRKCLLTLICILFTVQAACPVGNKLNLAYAQRLLHINRLIYKIAMIESGHNEMCVNSKENAVGLLQIRPIMVKEVNRILGTNKYKLKDRFDKDKSIEMFKVYQGHYNPNYDYKKAAFLWNGGSNYCKANKEKKKRLTKYYNKMKSV